MTSLRKEINSRLWRILGIVFFAFTMLIFVVGFIYLIWSFILIIKLISSSTVSQSLLNILSLIVEVIGIFYTVMLFFHVSVTCYFPPSLSPTTIKTIENPPLVSILIPIHNPNLGVLETTLQSISAQNYPRNQIQTIVGDDTENHPDLYKTKEICQKYNVDYIYDLENPNFKAGMVNIMLKHSKAKYVVFLDYDHKLISDYVSKNIAILEENEELAFVQSKVNFYNIKSKLQVWESVMYAQFFEIFNRSKTRRSMVLFNGSTACFRKEILEEIGGVPVATFTEDVDLSVQILTRGYKSSLLDEYGSFGLVPETFSLLLSQIIRWAKGSMHTLRKRWWLILSSKISIFEKLDLFFSTSLFFIASSMYLTILFYVIMFFTNSIAIRLPITLFPPLIVMPIAFSVSYLLSGLIAVIYARKSGLEKLRLRELVLFFVIALALNPFTVYAVIKTIFRFRAPQKGKDEWNEKIPIIPLSLIFSLLGVGIIIIAIFDFLGTGTLWLVLAFLGSSLIATFPISLYFLIKSKARKPNLSQEEENNLKVLSK